MGCHIVFKINILLVTHRIPLTGFLVSFTPIFIRHCCIPFSLSLCLFGSLRSPSSGTNPDRVWFLSIKFGEELKTYKHRTCREAIKVYIPPCVVFVRSPKVPDHRSALVWPSTLPVTYLSQHVVHWITLAKVELRKHVWRLSAMTGRTQKERQLKSKSRRSTTARATKRWVLIRKG